MPNGDLIRAGAESGFGPGAGGSVQRFNWEGDLVWDFSITSVGRDLQPHHDICPMPNGNTLICSGAQGIVFEVTSEGKTVWQYKHPGVDQAGGPQPAGNPEQGAANGGLRIGGPGGLFRVYRYASDYPAFEGKTLTPGEKLADLTQATD
jgi:hypothetical protein